MKKPWLHQYPAGVPESIDPDQYASLNELFDYCVQKYNQLPAFSNFDKTLSYQELAKNSQYFATFLQQQLKLQKGQRVAVMMPNLLQYPICIFGILKAGLVVVNVNPLYTARELKHQLEDADVSAVIVLSNFANTVETVLNELPIKHIIITRMGDMLGLKGSLINWVVKYIKRKEPAYNIANTISLTSALSIGKKLIFQDLSITGNDIAFLQYTGGTTGVAKGAILTHRNLVANILQCKDWVKQAVEPGKEKIMGSLPLYHIFALTVCAFCFMTLGGECVLITNPRDLKSFIKILIKYPPTIFMGLNTLFNGLSHQEKFTRVNFSKLKLTVAGGMPTQKVVAERWQSITGTPIIEGYGLTEASPVVTINPLNLKSFNGSVGLPVPSTNIKICNEQNHEVNFNELGELLIQGPQVMQGYWNQPAETAKVLDAQGWLRTGDIARIDERGFVYLIDRKKDMILVSGFNVYPNEVEGVLVMHKGVKEAAVVGIPSNKSEEAVKAFIVKQDPNLTDTEITEFCRKNLTGYKVPKVIEFVNELPKTNVGKVLRRELRGADADARYQH